MGFKILFLQNGGIGDWGSREYNINTYELGIEGISIQWGELKGEMVESRLPQRGDGDLREIKETERQLGFHRGWLSRGVAATRLLGGGRDNKLVMGVGAWQRRCCVSNNHSSSHGCSGEEKDGGFILARQKGAAEKEKQCLRVQHRFQLI